MTQKIKNIALITSSSALAEQLKDTFADSPYEVNVFRNGLELHRSLELPMVYQAIVADDELNGSNGISLHKILVGLGYGNIPFVMLLHTLDAEQRNLAMKENIAEIFSKPLNVQAFRLRVDYLAHNYSHKVSGYEGHGAYHLP